MIRQGASLRVEHTGAVNGKTGEKGWALTVNGMNLLYCETEEEGHTAYIKIMGAIRELVEGS